MTYSSEHLSSKLKSQLFIKEGKVIFTNLNPLSKSETPLYV